MIYRAITAVVLGLFLISATEVMAAQSSKEVSFKLKGGAKVTFSHDIHLKKNNSCRICHSAIYDLSKRRRHTMADMEKGSSCGACHNGKAAFSVAKEKDCMRCHKSSAGAIYYKIKGADAFFSHDSHVARNGGKCKDCHNSRIANGRRGVTMTQMEKGSSCGACHNGKTAFTAAANCGSCHKGLNPKDVTFKLKVNVPNADFGHKFHIAKYKCNDCHTKTFPYKAGAVRYTMADMEKGKSCGACHNGKTAFASTGDCAKCHKGLKPGNLTFKNARGTVVGYFKHDTHTAMFACKDCHTKIFNYAGDRRTTMKDMEKGKSCGACHDGKTGFSVKGDCLKCHKK